MVLMQCIWPQETQSQRKKRQQAAGGALSCGKDILNEAKALAQCRLPRLLLILFNRQDEHAPIGSALGILDACFIDSLVQTRVVRQIHHLRHIFAPRSLLAST